MIYLKRGLLVSIISLSIIFNLYAGDLETVMKSIKAGEIFEICKYLSSEETAGRLSGHEGYTKAAKWVADRFKEWGIEPVYGDFLQKTKVDYNEMGASALSLIVSSKEPEGKPEEHKMELYKDYAPGFYSGFGDVEADVVFVGYGITAPELGWDDYRSVDVKGKIVAFLHGAPEIKGKDFSRYFHRSGKIITAHKNGAVGIIILYRPVIAIAGTYIENLPVVMVGEKAASILFEKRGYEYKTVSKLLGDGFPIAFPNDVKARLRVEGVRHKDAETYNVVGMIKGSDPKLADEYIVFGAHLDHLGPSPDIYYGANDNASGSSIVMTLAHAFSQMEKKPKRSVVFALFYGEEMGLLGSEYMVNNPPVYPSKPRFMVNFDVNGNGNGIFISGAEMYPELYEFIKKANEEYRINNNIRIGRISAANAGSDYGPFLEKNIPSYANWPIGGSFEGYHTPEDTIYKISPMLMEDLARLYFVAGYRFADQ